jgi:hypothetical protein
LLWIFNFLFFSTSAHHHANRLTVLQTDMRRSILAKGLLMLVALPTLVYLLETMLSQAEDPGRLLRLNDLLHGSIRPSNSPKFEGIFDRILGWLALDATLFWNLPAWSRFEKYDFLVINLQRFGTCFLHAPIVLTHYHNVVWSNKASFDHVDIAKYVTLPGNEALKELYLSNQGGNSLLVLKSVSGAKDSDLVHWTLTDYNPVVLRVQAEQCADLFHQYGPALVRSMKVEDEFFNGNVVSHLDLPANPNFLDSDGQERKHAMVMIGHRKGQIKSFILNILLMQLDREGPTCVLAPELVEGKAVCGSVGRVSGSLRSRNVLLPQEAR